MSTLSCLALWSSYIESAAARWGFRAFKKALVAPYSAKVNNRDSSSRGTTHYEKIVECPVVSLEGGGAAGKTHKTDGPLRDKMLCRPVSA